MVIYLEQSCSFITLKPSLQYEKNQEIISKSLLLIPFLFPGRPEWDNCMKMQPECYLTLVTA